MEMLSECSICIDQAKDARVLTCGHYFCFDCIRDALNKKNLCPVCRNPVFSDVSELRKYN